MLHLATTGDIPTLDPALANDAESSAALELVLDTLVGYLPASTELVPQLASSYTVSPDRRTYHFTLRPEATFEDGTPVTSADVKASLERVLSPATASPGASFYLDIVGAEAFHRGLAKDVTGISAVGPEMIDFTLQAPSESFPYRLAMKFAAPQPRGGRPEPPSATGPFRISDVVPGVRITFARNPRYWCAHGGEAACRSLPYLDGVTLDLGQDRTTQLLRLRKGDLDVVTQIPHADAPGLLRGDDPALRVEVRPVLATSEIVLDTARPPLDDIRVRRALNLAISKMRLRKISADLLTPGACVLPPGIAGNDDAAIPAYPYDPAEARRLLAAAGHSTMTLEIAAAEDSAVLESVVADLDSIGLTATVHLYAPAALYGSLGRRGTLAAAYISYAADYPSPDDLLDGQFSPRGTNWSFFDPPGLEALLDVGRSAPDASKRRRAYLDAERMIREDAPWIFLGYEQAVVALSRRVHDAPIHPVWQREYRAAWLEGGGK